MGTMKTLVCINSCEKDICSLGTLKESELYRKMDEDSNIRIIEVFSGGNIILFDGSRLVLSLEEQYDKLHRKTYEMIKYCVDNFSFERLVKLDSNILTYDKVGERTRRKLCGLDRVNRVIFKCKNMEYLGTFGRKFSSRLGYTHLRNKDMEVSDENLGWFDKFSGEFFGGKCYGMSRAFAKFIASPDERVLAIVEQHDRVGLEDVMVGRLYEICGDTKNG